MDIWIDLKEFFFPRWCLVCGRKLLREEHAACIFCMGGLPRTGLMNTPGNEMERLFWGLVPLERASSLFLYTKGGAVAQLLYAMKYHGRRLLCCQMGELIVSEIGVSGFFDGIDFLIPVPLHKSRLRKRGYNQCDWLARGISSKTHIPICTTALRRERNNQTQTHFSSYERWENTISLFRLTPEAARLEGKHVLLIDDVLTTGATLVACATVLSKVKGLRISVLTLAWAKYNAI